MSIAISLLGKHLLQIHKWYLHCHFAVVLKNPAIRSFLEPVHTNPHLCALFLAGTIRISLSVCCKFSLLEAFYPKFGIHFLFCFSTRDLELIIFLKFKSFRWKVTAVNFVMVSFSESWCSLHFVIHTCFLVL